MTLKQVTTQAQLRLAAAWPTIVILIVCIALAVLAFPYTASAYHLEAGGRILDQIGESANQRSGEAADSYQLSAISHLQAAIRWDARNAQAYRLLGRAYLAQGDLVAAAEALTRFTELRPANPLGHIELAEVYEELESELQTHVHYDFLAHLPEAKIETAGFWIDTIFCEEGDPPEKCYVAETAFHMPADAAPRPTLFMHAPSRASYTLTLPDEPMTLSFGMGLHPMTWSWGGDGVTFEVFVDDGEGEQQLLAERLDIAAAMGGWKDGKVDLAAYAGQTVTLTLSVIPGPEWEMTGDWAGWGEPRLVDAEALPLTALRPAEQMVRQWQAAGLTAQDFIARGEEERQAKQYQEALRWYERATWLEPGLGDGWYYIGLAYEGLEQWKEALGAYEQAIETGSFASVHRSSPPYRLGAIYQWRLEPRQTDAALAAYEAAIATNDFSADWEAADCHYKRGEILWWQGSNPDEYIAAYKRAIALNPQHASAHMLLGVAYYTRDKDVAMAETEIRRAIELSPQNKWAYYHLGEIYRQEGRMDEARAMYEQALEIDPQFEAAKGRLEALSNSD
ncbi:MAG: tetratricopeptide repeat protein [Anaerolineae bacterium]|nr:tetratricopeptide repeat protein [Anaerolineae bacterium]MDH7472949.1 tetratricopeptide repeat protein [Anaerolineae bacterium]